MSRTALNEPWATAERQEVATLFGMWSFLATETLFFGSLLLFYAIARFTHPEGFSDGARETQVVYGTVNTVVLLTSSLTMAIAERAVKEGLASLARVMFAATLALGLIFLGVKAMEYHADIVDHLVPGPHFKLATTGAGQFWAFYWTATGVHACHMLIGLGVVLRMMLIPASEVPSRWTTAQGSALYWHLVDVIWVVLYALIYLVGR